MEENHIRLTFKCPVKWDSMAAADGGRYCDSCKKTVKDFAGDAQPVEEGHECGSFYATQLHRPFNDRRDVLIAHYQSLRDKRPGSVLFMLVTAVLFITGCHHARLTGAYARYTKQVQKKKTVEMVSIEKKKAKL